MNMMDSTLFLIFTVVHCGLQFSFSIVSDRNPLVPQDEMFSAGWDGAWSIGTSCTVHKNDFFLLLVFDFLQWLTVFMIELLHKKVTILPGLKSKLILWILPIHSPVKCHLIRSCNSKLENTVERHYWLTLMGLSVLMTTRGPNN